MSTNQLFDDFEDESKYKSRKKNKMKTLRDDKQYGAIFNKSNKVKNLDPSMFDEEIDELYYEDYDDRNYH